MRGNLFYQKAQNKYLNVLVFNNKLLNLCRVNNELLNQQSKLIMTLRVYRNEYDTRFMKQIENGTIEGIEVETIADNVIVVSGDDEILDKLSCLMYATDNKIKSLFPSYITAKEQEEKNLRDMRDSIMDLGQTLVKISTGFHRLGVKFDADDYKMFDDLRSIYLELNEKYL